MNDAKLKILFGSACRIKVLRHYFENPYGGFYIRELTTVLKEHMNNVRRELIKLEKLGILKKVEKGRLNYFYLKECDLAHDLAKVFGYNSTPNQK